MLALTTDETSEDDSYVGVVINPYCELLTVVSEDQEAFDRKIPLDDTSPITFGALLSDYAKELPDFQINFNLKMLFLCFVVFPFFPIPKTCSDHISRNGIISCVLQRTRTIRCDFLCGLHEV